ncbi:MAG: putative amidoligase domain-containing protein [Candidatus Hodarchaeales archaeon]|jgi:hypothetical protein
MIKLDKIGSDPEFGIVSKDGENLPSFMFFDGTKHEPEDMGNGFAILKDNLLVEGNIPACSNEEEFVDSMKFLKGIIQIVLDTQEAKLASEDILEYNQLYVFSPDGQEFGCSNFKSAYKRGVIRTPAMRGMTRQIGNHIHFSYKIDEDATIKTKEAFNKVIVKAMDYFIGIPSDKIKYTKERRESYGALGSYRTTKYGGEYRSLGGFFTQDKYLPWIYKQTVKAFDFCKDPENVEKLKGIKFPSEENYKLLNINLKEQLPE